MKNLNPTFAAAVAATAPAPIAREFTPRSSMDEWERAGDKYYREQERRYADRIGDAADRAGERS